jgi:putative hydrolase of the HAD superfamily
MLDISRIQAITLDLDDTLWPVWPTIARAETRLQEWLTPSAPLSAQTFADLKQRKVLRDTVLAAHPHLQHDLSFIRREMIRGALAQCGEDEALTEPAYEVFFSARQEVDLFDDALGALRQLASRWPVLALSNGNADVQRIGIGQYFCGSHSAREAGAAKPDVRIFHSAAATLQLAPEAILHVGDDPEMDVLGALDAGMQTAWVNRNDHVWPHPRDPHVRVGSLAALCEVLGL